MCWKCKSVPSVRGEMIDCVCLVSKEDWRYRPPGSAIVSNCSRDAQAFRICLLFATVEVKASPDPRNGTEVSLANVDYSCLYATLIVLCFHLVCDDGDRSEVVDVVGTTGVHSPIFPLGSHRRHMARIHSPTSLVLAGVKFDVYTLEDSRV